MTPNLYQLIAALPRRPNGRRWSISALAMHLNESRSTLTAFADGTIKEYPHVLLEKLSSFFGCDPGQLWVTTEVADEVVARADHAAAGQ